MLPQANRFYLLPFNGNLEFPVYPPQPLCFSSFPTNFTTPVFHLDQNFSHGISYLQPHEPPTKSESVQSRGKTACVSKKIQKNRIQTCSFQNSFRSQKRLSDDAKLEFQCQSQSQEFQIEGENLKRKRSGICKLAQNQNRNIVPCMVQQVMAYICKESKSGQVCAKVLKHLGHPKFVEVKSYYSFMKTIKSGQSNYVNIKSLKVLSSQSRQQVQAFSKEQRRFYLKIGRTLAQYFLQIQCFSHIYYSKKVNPNKKEEQLKARRLILGVLRELEE